MNRIYTIYRDPGFVDTRAGSPDDPASNLRPLTSDAQRARFGLGDWVETWAKPIGCLIDRCTNAPPGWLVKTKPFTGIRAATRKPRLKPKTFAWYYAKLTRPLDRLPYKWYWPLPHQLRTGFCVGTCGCNARKRKLNAWIPDLRHFLRIPKLF